MKKKTEPQLLSFVFSNLNISLDMDWVNIPLDNVNVKQRLNLISLPHGPKLIRIIL